MTTKPPKPPAAHRPDAPLDDAATPPGARRTLSAQVRPAAASANGLFGSGRRPIRPTPARARPAPPSARPPDQGAATPGARALSRQPAPRGAAATPRGAAATARGPAAAPDADATRADARGSATRQHSDAPQHRRPLQTPPAPTSSTLHAETVFDVFLPCASGVEPYLATEVQRIADAAPLVNYALPISRVTALRGGVTARANWAGVMRLNLHSRLSQRVLIELARPAYRTEDDLYAAVYVLQLSDWFTLDDSFRIDLTSRNCPLQSLNFAALRIKDAVVDRFRADTGQRPNVDRDWPAVRLHAHLESDHLVLSIDTSGEPLFKRGWRDDTGDAPLKETLAAAMLAACGWDPFGPNPRPLYDPCCGSGTIAIEAAHIASRTPPGMQRHFGFERLRLHDAAAWSAIKSEAASAVIAPQVAIFGSDVSHRMVDFAQRNAQRAGVADWVQLRGGDALQRMPPAERGLMLLNPPYGERIGVGGQMRGARSGRERVVMDTPPEQDGDAPSAETAAFFTALAAHWKAHFGGWQAWLLSPDAQLPSHLRLKPLKRVPMFNGPIECRLMGFDLVARNAA